MSLLVVTINDLRCCMRPDPSCSAVQIGCGNCHSGVAFLLGQWPLILAPTSKRLMSHGSVAV